MLSMTGAGWWMMLDDGLIMLHDGLWMTNSSWMTDGGLAYG